MAMRLFLVYAVIELAVIVALASTIGFGWTVLLLLGTFLVGLALAGSQVKRHIRRLQSGLTAATVQGAATDSVLVALGTFLAVAFAIGVVAGPVDIGVGDVLRSLGEKLGIPGVTSPLDPTQESILWEIRVPRVMLAAPTLSVLVALGTVLTVIPGLASSVLGALLLLPPTRAAVRPLVTAMAARRAPLITEAATGAGGARWGHRAAGRGEYIDGEVIDVVDVEPPAVERKPE